MAKKQKVGIIGCGLILSRHLEAIEQNPKNYELVVVCDIDKKKVDKAAKKAKVP